MTRSKAVVVAASTEIALIEVPDPTSEFREWAVEQALHALVGGELPYDPDSQAYYPSDPARAQKILLRSAQLCANMVDATPAVPEVRRHLAASWAKLGVMIPAPFAHLMATRLKELHR